MKVYIAGPMTGFPAYNHKAFYDARAEWMGRGWEVETPFDANSRVWERHFGRPFDAYNDTCDYGDPILKEMFAEDVKVLLSSDVMAVLDGWENSKGATLEYQIASQFGIPVVLASHPRGSLERCVRAEAGELRTPA